MKKRSYLAVMLLYMAVTCSACFSQSETEIDTESLKEDKTSQKEETVTSSDETRLVSVEKVENYISLSEYKGLEIEKADLEVTDADVLEWIQKSLDEEREKMNAKATIQSGDLVTLNYIGTVDGKTFDSSVAYYYDVIIGEGDLIAELEESLLGMKKGETKVVKCTYPSNYRSAEVAGKEAEFTITIQSIRRTPELTEEWVKENTDFETVEDYKAYVKETMTIESEERTKLHIWQTILTNSEVLEYPEKDIENAIAAYKQQILLYAQQAEMNLETFVESQGLTIEEFDAQCRQYAEKKVKQNLVVQAIMDREGFSLDDEDSLAIQDRIMEEYQASSLADLVDCYSLVEIDESIGLLRVEEFIYENIVIIEPITEVISSENTEADSNGTEADSEDTEAQSKNTEAKKKKVND